MINAFNKLIMLMGSGQLVTLEQFKEHFKNDVKMSNTMYRISAYMCDMKRQMHAVVRSHKNGRNVIGYQLINYKDYDKNGRYTKDAKYIYNQLEEKSSI